MLGEGAPCRLQVDNVTKLFGSLRALDRVSLDVRGGEFVSILGASGSGKSTLLRVIAGLERSEGSVSIGGEPVETLAPKDRGVAFVFQSYALYPQMSVAENIAAPLVMQDLRASDRIPVIGSIMPGAGTRRSAVAEKVRKTAESLQIETLLDRRPSQLSGGQRQRVALARALIRQPKLFLLDEPLANLDAALRLQTRSELRALQTRLGTTTLFVTHDQAEAMAISDRIAVMFDGRIRQVGTPDELYRQPVDIDVARFLSQPVLNTLAATRSDGKGVTVAGVRLSIPNSSHGDGVVAFRPQGAGLIPHGDGQPGMPVRIEAREHAGADAFVRVRVIGSGEPATVRVPSAELGRWPEGGEAGLVVDPQAAWFFPMSEQRFVGLAA